MVRKYFNYPLTNVHVLLSDVTLCIYRFGVLYEGDYTNKGNYNQKPTTNDFIKSDLYKYTIRLNSIKVKDVKLFPVIGILSNNHCVTVVNIDSEGYYLYHDNNYQELRRVEVGKMIKLYSINIF